MKEKDVILTALENGEYVNSIAEKKETKLGRIGKILSIVVVIIIILFLFTIIGYLSLTLREPPISPL